MKKKIKIFLFNPYPAIGGVDNTIKSFFSNTSNDFEIEYLSLKKNTFFKNKRIKNTVIKASSTFSSFFKIYKIFKNDKSDLKIFISFQYFANIWSILFIKILLQGKLFIYEVNHLDELNYYDNFNEYIKKIIIKFSIKFLYKYPDIVGSNSKELSQDLNSYIGRKVHTIYNPCFNKVKIRKEKYKKKSKIKILSISRFVKQKDHITLLKSINNSKFKDKIFLDLVGYGKEYFKIKNFIKKNKIKAKIHLNKTKIDNFYKKADLYICTSLYEGLPTTLIEAASYCLPIISSNFKSGSKEIFKHGRAGYLFNVGDHVYLSRLIDQFITKPKLFYSKERICRKNLFRFSQKKNTNLLFKLIKSLI